MRNAAIVVLMFVVTVPVFADQSSKNPTVTMRFGALRKDQSKDPYKQLFGAQQAPKKTPQQAAEDLKPKVVCGMMIIPANPDLDPKMRVTPPQDSNLEYKMRVAEPPMCFDKSDKK